MRTFFIIVTIVLLRTTLSLTYAQTNRNVEIAEQITRAAEEDQKWRGLLRQIENNEINTLNKEFVSKQITLTDSLNYILLSRVFNQYGYLGKDIIGENVAHQFWLLVQHADKHPKFQDSVLTAMKSEIVKGNAALYDYAYLVDRVKVNLGELQVYGTQMKLNSSETSYEIQPVIEPEKLNERRQEVQLPPIEIYIKAMNERYYGTLKK